MKFIEAYDDIDYARDKTKTVATYRDVPLTWKNKTVKLDLGDANYRMLDDLLGPLTKAAEPVKNLTPAGRKSVAHGGRRPAAYYEGLVEWVDRNRISKRDTSGRPAYAGSKPDGRNDYPDWLVKMYDEHLAGPGDQLSA